MMNRCRCGNLLRASSEQRRRLCLECQIAGKKCVLTPSGVLQNFSPVSWLKVAPTRIRAITVDDVARMGDSFLDLERRAQRVAVGRYLCVGVQGEHWTCSQIRDRMPVSEPDQDEFRQYVQLTPKPVACFDIPFPFLLQVDAKEWESQADGGIITWNERAEPDLDMRVVERSIFHATYIRYNEQMAFLPVPVPTQLEECCGYTGEARYVAFYWGGGDESYYADGRASRTGEWDGYQAYVDHWCIQPALRGFDLGSSEGEAVHWLLLDRQTRRVSVAKAEVVGQLLRQQWGIPDQEPVVQQFSERVHAISQQNIVASMVAHQKQVSGMRAWLDHVGNR